MADFMLRPATQEDFPAIRQLIHLVGINPMSLDWRRFLVAVDSSGQLLGCGQLKPHGKELVELASIAVQPASSEPGHRACHHRTTAGTGRRGLCTWSAGCNSVRSMKSGVSVPVTRRDEMPAYFRRLSRLAGLFSSVTPEGDGMLVMELM